MQRIELHSCINKGYESRPGKGYDCCTYMEGWTTGQWILIAASDYYCTVLKAPSFVPLKDRPEAEIVHLFVLGDPSSYHSGADMSASDIQ